MTRKFVAQPIRDSHVVRWSRATWEREIVIKRVKTVRSGVAPEKRAYYDKGTAITQVEVQSVAADFVCEIDLAALLLPLMHKAASAKTGKSRLAGGAIKVTRQTVDTEGTERKNYPLTSGWELAEGETQ